LESGTGTLPRRHQRFRISSLAASITIGRSAVLTDCTAKPVHRAFRPEPEPACRRPGEWTAGDRDIRRTDGDTQSRPGRMGEAAMERRHQQRIRHQPRQRHPADRRRDRARRVGAAGNSVVVGISANDVDRWGPCPLPDQAGPGTGTGGATGTNRPHGFQVTNAGCIDRTTAAHDQIAKGYPTPAFNLAGKRLFEKQFYFSSWCGRMPPHKSNPLRTWGV
jgi:hypothetical protein